MKFDVVKCRRRAVQTGTNLLKIKLGTNTSISAPCDPATANHRPGCSEQFSMTQWSSDSLNREAEEAGGERKSRRRCQGEEKEAGGERRRRSIRGVPDRRRSRSERGENREAGGVQSCKRHISAVTSHPHFLPSSNADTHTRKRAHTHTHTATFSLY